MLLSYYLFFRHILSPPFVKIKVKSVIPTPASKTFNNKTLTISLAMQPPSIHSSHCSLWFSWNTSFKCFPCAILLCSHYFLLYKVLFPIPSAWMVSLTIGHSKCFALMSHNKNVFLFPMLCNEETEAQARLSQGSRLQPSWGPTSAFLGLVNTLRTTIFYCLCRFSWIQPHSSFTWPVFAEQLSSVRWKGG